MLESKYVYIFGYSGHAYVVIESLLNLGYHILGYFDYEKAKNNPYGLKYLGFELDVNVNDIVKNHFVFPTVGDNVIRKKLLAFFDEKNLNQLRIIDPSANISKSATLGKSTYVGKNVQINALARVGEGVILNTGCILEHECQIGHGVHIAPGSVLCGSVKVGDGSFIGAQAVVKENISISANIKIGAGSVVVKNIKESGTYFGNPAKLLKVNPLKGGLNPNE
ncbi:MAG: acetyltransferase [Flavobacteriaceae bacterium]